MTAHFDAKQQLKRIHWSTADCYALLFFSPFGVCLVTVLCVLYASCWREVIRFRTVARDVSLYLPLILPGLLGLLVYALVLVGSRYIAPFLVLVSAALFARVRLTEAEAPCLASAAVVATTVVFLTTAGPVTVRNTKFQMPEHLQWNIARHLLRLAVRRGDKVAFIGRRAFFARVARIRVTVVMRPESQLEKGHVVYDDYVWRFWSADRKTRQHVLYAVARTGVTAVVADRVPPLADTPGWTRLGNTEMYAWLPKAKS